MLIAFSHTQIVIAQDGALILLEPEHRCKIIHDLAADVKIVKLACTRHGGVALTDTGQVIFFERYARTFECDSVISDITCNERQTLLVTKKGAFIHPGNPEHPFKTVPPPVALTLGPAKLAYISNGRLYIDDQHVKHHRPVVQVAVGGGHTVFIDNEGELFGFGSNFKGQLGRGVISFATSPVRVPFFTRALKVAAGNEHTVVLDQNQTAWICGSNEHGELGPVDTVDNCRWGLGKLYDGVADIAARGYATLLLFTNGNVEEIGTRYEKKSSPL